MTTGVWRFWRSAMIETNTCAKDCSSSSGFTLVEVLAALAIFSIGAMGLVQIATENTRSIGRIETVALARIVADNEMAEFLSRSGPVEVGASESREVELGGRKWRWVRVVQPTPNALMVSVRVKVSEVGPADKQAETPQTIAETVAFRSRS